MGVKSTNHMTNSSNHMTNSSNVTFQSNKREAYMVCSFVAAGVELHLQILVEVFSEFSILNPRVLSVKMQPLLKVLTAVQTTFRNKSSDSHAWAYLKRMFRLSLATDG